MIVNRGLDTKLMVHGADMGDQPDATPNSAYKF